MQDSQKRLKPGGEETAQISSQKGLKLHAEELYAEGPHAGGPQAGTSEMLQGRLQRDQSREELGPRAGVMEARKSYGF